MCTFCELPLNEHAIAVARFITDKSDYDDSYCADTDQYGWWGVIDETTDEPIFGGKNMDEFNDAYGVWWDEHYPGDMPF